MEVGNSTGRQLSKNEDGLCRSKRAVCGPKNGLKKTALLSHINHPQVPLLPLAHRHCCQRLVPLRNLCCPPQSCQGEQGRQRSFCHPLPLPFDWMSYLDIGLLHNRWFWLTRGPLLPPEVSGRVWEAWLRLTYISPSKRHPTKRNLRFKQPRDVQKMCFVSYWLPVSHHGGILACSRPVCWSPQAPRPNLLTKGPWKKKPPFQGPCPFHCYVFFGPLPRMLAPACPILFPFWPIPKSNTHTHIYIYIYIYIFLHHILLETPALYPTPPPHKKKRTENRNNSMGFPHACDGPFFL